MEYYRGNSQYNIGNMPPQFNVEDVGYERNQATKKYEELEVEYLRVKSRTKEFTMKLKAKVDAIGIGGAAINTEDLLRLQEHLANMLNHHPDVLVEGMNNQFSYGRPTDKVRMEPSNQVFNKNRRLKSNTHSLPHDAIRQTTVPEQQGHFGARKNSLDYQINPMETLSRNGFANKFQEGYENFTFNASPDSFVNSQISSFTTLPKHLSTISGKLVTSGKPIAAQNNERMGNAQFYLQNNTSSIAKDDRKPQDIIQHLLCELGSKLSSDNRQEQDIVSTEALLFRLANQIKPLDINFGKNLDSINSTHSSPDTLRVQNPTIQYQKIPKIQHAPMHTSLKRRSENAGNYEVRKIHRASKAYSLQSESELEAVEALEGLGNNVV